jgi:hypothetical protein
MWLGLNVNLARVETTKEVNKTTTRNPSDTLDKFDIRNYKFDPPNYKKNQEIDQSLRIRFHLYSIEACSLQNDSHPSHCFSLSNLRRIFSV